MILNKFDFVLIACVFALVSYLFFMARSVQSENIRSVLISEIQEFAQLRDTYALGRAVQRLEDLRLIKCTKISVVKTDSPRLVVLDHTRNPDCGFYITVFGSRIAQSVRSLDGTQAWELDTISLTDPVYLTLFPILLVGGVMAIVISSRFRRLRRQRQLAQQEMSMKIAEERQRLALQVAHDIRSPLSALNILSAKLDNFDQRSLMESVVKKINSIAEDILTKSRESSSESQALVNVDLKRLILSIAEQKRLEFPDRQILVEIGGDDFFQQAHETVLFRILSNLVNNAAESSKDLPIKIRLERSSEEGAVCLSVIDGGKGIPASDLGKLGVQKFSSKKDGNGLGLVHAKSQIESWDGKLEINSKVGEGTTVKLIFPPHS